MVIPTNAFQVMTEVGKHLFIEASSDSTGNTSGAREIIHAMMPQILNLPDPIHHLNNTWKDISQLSYFAPVSFFYPGFRACTHPGKNLQVVKSVRITIRFFKHSNVARALLKDLCIKKNLGRGLESIGKTRFVTLVWSAESVQHCLPAIRELVTNSQITIPVSNSTKSYYSNF